MYRFLLSAASIFFLLTAALLPPATLAARRCSVKMPVTLLSLYRNSEFIYIGRYDKLEEGGLINETDDYREVSMNKHFSISSALKGETRKMITLKDSEYRYKVVEAAPEAAAKSDEEEPAARSEDEDKDTDESEGAESEVSDETGADEEEDINLVRPGDSVLLFMKKDDDSDDLVLSDYTDGLKRMTPEKLAAYEVRIRELNEIFAGEKPSYSRVVAWLVRCAEDPHTRWEGTYELLQSFQRMEYIAEQVKTRAHGKPSDGSEDEVKAEDETTAEDEAYPWKHTEFETGDPNFAKNLSEGEKLILTNVLLKRGSRTVSRDPEGESSRTRGDSELIELVRRWGDSKVAASLLDELGTVSADADLSSELMSSIASILDDEELLSVSAEYSSIRWEDADAEVEAEETEQAAGGEAEESDEPASEPGVELSNADSKDQVPESESTGDDVPDKVQPAKKKTYGEMRKDLVQRFLARASALIAAGEHAERDQ